MVFPEGLSANARHAVFKKIDADVCSWLGTTGQTGPSSTGIHRTTTYVYPASYGSSALKEGVRLELGSRGGEIPASEHQFRSMVAIYAEEAYGDGESVWEEFASFPVTALAPERTLLEKLAAVHAAATSNDHETIAQYGRHFYDIGQLLTSEHVRDALAALGTEGVASLVDDIDRRSEAAGWKYTPRPDGGFADSPAFDGQHEAHTIVQRGYTAALELVHGVAPSLADVFDTVRANRALLQWAELPHSKQPSPLGAQVSAVCFCRAAFDCPPSTIHPRVAREPSCLTVVGRTAGGRPRAAVVIIRW